MKKKIDKTGYLFIAPYCVFFLIFVAYPLGFSIYLVFHRWDLISAPEFVGWRNIEFLIHDDIFWTSLYNTLIFLLIHIPTQIVVALTLAWILVQKIRARTFFRAAFFLPVVVSGAVVTILWLKIYATEMGIINTILGKMGIPDIPWLTHPSLAMPSIAIMATWKNVGFYIVLFMVGLQNIPHSLYEAAAMEGANKRQTFFSVVLPLLRPTMVLVVIISTINGFNLFIEPYVMTGGGPMNSSMSLVLYIYKQAFSYQHMGYAATIGLALSLLIFCVTLLQRKIIDRGQ